jgi:hypothetical protein
MNPKFTGLDHCRSGVVRVHFFFERRGLSRLGAPFCSSSFKAARRKQVRP